MEGGPQGLWGWKGGGLGTPSEQLGYLGAVGVGSGVKLAGEGSSSCKSAAWQNTRTEAQRSGRGRGAFRREAQAQGSHCKCTCFQVIW